MTTEKFISTGSGSPVAHSYLEVQSSVNDGYKIAIQAIAAAIKEKQALVMALMQ